MGLQRPGIDLVANVQALPPLQGYTVRIPFQPRTYVLGYFRPPLPGL
jgi:hypothetical protein